ncbi:MAG TPA: hypothetical protein VE135_04545 [Pyrinomonadaceae bacterium]|nr:hypothetical protein [Pyrinomonadaceae bacterium]
MKGTTLQHVFLLLVLGSLAISIQAQTTTFTYQGKLNDTGAPANGTYLMEFKLYDSLSDGTQIGSTISNPNVTVTNGLFTVNLNFGSSPFVGADRYLQIAVKRNAGDPFSVLSPRQQIASSPYSIQTIKAQQADMALDSQKLGGVNASEYVTNATTNFVRNQSGQQPSSNFNVSGNGVVGGRFGLRTASPAHLLGIAAGSAYPQWTSDGWIGGIELPNISAIGWQPNAAGRSFGIGQTFGGLHFFRTTSPPGLTSTPPLYDLLLSNNGNIGIGTTNPNSTSKVEIAAQDGLRISGFQPFLTLSDLNAGKTTFVQGVNGDAALITNSRHALVVKDGSGNVGIGTSNPTARLFVEGEANSGVGIQVTGDAVQSPDKYGWAKAMLFVDGGGTILQCYNGVTGNSSSGCGFTVSHPISGFYTVDVGFNATGRFAVASTKQEGSFHGTAEVNTGGGVIFVRTWNTNSQFQEDRSFTLVLF